VDIAIECVALPLTWQWAVDMVRRGGLVNFFGGPAQGTRVELDTNHLHYNDIELKASFHHTPAVCRQAMNLIASPSFDADAFITGHARLRDLEHMGDEITHCIVKELNRTFITPFDREDIYALAGAVDDVIDLAEETADIIVLDRVDGITAEAQQMGDLLIKIGITMMSAGSHTEPGGYTHQGKDNLHRTVRGRIVAPEFHNGMDEVATGQFEISDERSASEIAKVLRKRGYEPVWKDWEQTLSTV